MYDFRPFEPPIELYVVGERADDPSQLLLRGSDGHYYAYEPADGHPHPVEIDDDWILEAPLRDDVMV